MIDFEVVGLAQHEWRGKLGYLGHVFGEGGCAGEITIFAGLDPEQPATSATAQTAIPALISIQTTPLRG